MVICSGRSGRGDPTNKEASCKRIPNFSKQTHNASGHFSRISVWALSGANPENSFECKIYLDVH